MKLCPCGYAGDPTRVCVCGQGDIQRYRSRLSGPLLDRIDLHVTLSPVPLRELGVTAEAEPSHEVRVRVQAARHTQLARYSNAAGIDCNARARGRLLLNALGADARTLLDSAAESLALSARAYHRVVKVARTIADLAARPAVAATHVAEALRYRPMLERR